MKKLFTFIAVALVAMTANAQVVFDGSEDTGAGLTKGDVTVAFGTDTYTFTANTPTTDGITLAGYWSGSANPNKIDGANYSASKTTAPSTGSVILLTPAKSGTLSVYVVVNASKAIFVAEDGAAINFSLNGADATPGTKLDEKGYGVSIAFAATAGKTYAVFCTASKMGFYGYNLVSAGPKKISAASLNGTYSVDQTATEYIASNYASSASVDRTYNTASVSVDGTAVTVAGIVNGTYTFNLTGTVDADAQTITFPAQTIWTWYTVAAADGAENIVATYTLDGDSVRITFPAFNITYGGSAYDYYTKLNLATKYVEREDPVEEWTSEANITYYNTNGDVVYTGKCNISRWTNKSYKYQVTNYGNPEANTYTKAVNFNAIEGTDSLTLDYSNAYNGYYYYVLNNADDMWMEGGATANQTAIVGNDTEGSLSWYYWQFDLNNSYAQLNEGNVVVSWPYVAIDTTYYDVKANITVTMNSKEATQVEIASQKIGTYKVGDTYYAVLPEVPSMDVTVAGISSKVWMNQQTIGNLALAGNSVSLKDTKKTTLIYLNGTKVPVTVTSVSGTLAEGAVNVIVGGKFEFNGQAGEILVQYTGQSQTTGIADVNAANASAKAAKFVKNGQVVIVKDGKQFNVAGALLK